MDTYNDPEIEEVVLCCASQVGKSECLNNIMCYIVDQDPSPALVVYPTLEMAQWVSTDRLQPMFRLSGPTAKRFREADSKDLELQFDGMYLVLSGANSPASLATRPIRFALFDETDKYPEASGREADPISLAKERAKTFWNRRLYLASTPTIELGVIWPAYMACNVRKAYHVPCPYCGHYQTLKFKQIKWPEGERNPQIVRDVAWYECEACRAVIEDRHKPQMLRLGEWRAENEPVGRVRSVGYHLNSIYSPWITFGEVAAHFLSAKDFPEKLRNFVNSWLGEPWRDKARRSDSDVVLERAWTHPRGVVPEGTVFLTAGVDVQENHFWWTVRAWGAHVTSWLVDYGRAETWPEIIEAIVNRPYLDKLNRRWLVRLCCMDSGYRTDEVYQLCAQYPELLMPAKGSSKRLNAPYTVSNIDRAGFQGLKLWIADTAYFKDFVHGRLQKPVGQPGAWMVFADCPREYAEHIVSEQKVVRQDRRTGRTIEEWVPVGSHALNHLLDCEVYAALAAEILGIRYVGEVQAERPAQESPKPASDEGPGTPWLPVRDWFGSGR